MRLLLKFMRGLTLSSFYFYLKVGLFIVLQLVCIFLVSQHMNADKSREKNLIDYKLQHQNTLLKESFVRAIETADSSIESLRLAIGRRTFNNDWDAYDRYKFIKSYINTNVSMLTSYSIYDENGDLYANSFVFPFKIVNIKDRQYFKNAISGMDREYFGPYFGRVINTWSFSIIRRLSKADGSFNGVLVGTVDLKYFTDSCANRYVVEVAETFIVNSSNLILAKCSGPSGDMVSKNFFEVMAEGKFKRISLDIGTNIYYTDKWVLFSTPFTGESGLRLVTLATLDVAYVSLDVLTTQNSMLYGLIGVVEFICLLLYISSLVALRDYQE